MELEERVRHIEERNRRVEAEKAWEMSATRVAMIVAITYVIACVVLLVIGNENAYRNALIPAVGYFLSTLSIPTLKKIWITKYISK